MDTVSRCGEAERIRTELWIGSVRTYNRRRREQARWLWVRHFDKMADLHTRLAADYQRKADALMSEEGEL
jgi:hypothetical protein